MKGKLLVSVFVNGENYSHYIPFFLFFMQKSYPEYFTLISCKDTLPHKVKENIGLLDNSFFKINENVFSEFPDDVDTSKTVRWVLAPEEYNDFEYIYITDIDILTIIEEPSLFDRHLKQMKDNNLPYSTPMDIPNRGTRLGGLFFFDRKAYLDIALPTMDKYRKILLQKNGIDCFWNKHLNKRDNQLALYKIVTESGLAIPKEHSFTYHGLHLGHSRCNGRWESFLGKDRPVAEGDHKKYFERYLLLTHDMIFWKMLTNSIHMIQKEVSIMSVVYNQIIVREERDGWKS